MVTWVGSAISDETEFCTILCCTNLNKTKYKRNYATMQKIKLPGWFAECKA